MINNINEGKLMKKLGLMLLLVTVILAECSSNDNTETESSTAYIVLKTESYDSEGSLFEVIEYTYDEKGIA